MAESDGEKGFWGGQAKHSPAAATQSSTPGRMLNPVLVRVPTSGPRGCHLVFLFLTLKCGENYDTDKQVSEKLSVSTVGTDRTSCHHRKLHLVNKNKPFVSRFLTLCHHFLGDGVTNYFTVNGIFMTLLVVRYHLHFVLTVNNPFVHAAIDCNKFF